MAKAKVKFFTAKTFYGDEPEFKDSTITPENYRIELMVAMNYYSHIAAKTKRTWVSNWLKANGKKVSLIKGVPNDRLSTVANMARMSLRGFPFNKEHDEKIFDDIKSLSKQYKKSAVVITEDDEDLKELAKSEVEDMLFGEIMLQFDSLIDRQMIETKQLKAKAVDCDSLNVGQFKQLQEYYNSQYVEIKVAVNKGDDYIVEGYRGYTPLQLTKILKLYESIEGVLLAQENLRSMAKPFKRRKVKVYTPTELTKGVKFLTEDKKLKLKSLTPEKLVGCSQAYIFNTKTRKLLYFFSPAGITVKGSTLGNFTESQSYAKTIRKPEEFLKELLKSPKVRGKKSLDAIKAKASPVTGRVNTHCIILKVWK